MKKIRFFLLTFFMVWGTGCAHVFQVHVDAINDGRPNTPGTYVIVPGDANTPADDLQFREYAMYLGRALQSNGYMPAKEKQTPDLEIYLTYGLGAPRLRSRQYTVPVWGQTGTNVLSWENTHATPSGSSTVSGTNVTPEYGVTGYATQEENYTVYPKYVEVEAYRVKKNVQPGDRLEEVWKTTIHAEGKHKELRHVFPILMAAAAKYLGGNSGGEITVRLTKNGAEVKRIKGVK